MPTISAASQGRTPTCLGTPPSWGGGVARHGLPPKLARRMTPSLQRLTPLRLPPPPPPPCSLPLTGLSMIPCWINKARMEIWITKPVLWLQGWMQSHGSNSYTVQALCRFADELDGAMLTQRTVWGCIPAYLCHLRHHHAYNKQYYQKGHISCFTSHILASLQHQQSPSAFQQQASLQPLKSASHICLDSKACSQGMAASNSSASQMGRSCIVHACMYL